MMHKENNSTIAVHRQEGISTALSTAQNPEQASNAIEDRALSRPIECCSKSLQNAFLKQTLKTLPQHKSNLNELHNTTVKALLETGGRDVLAEMITHQLIALHIQAMAMLSEASESHHIETQNSYLNQANKLLRTYAVLSEALRKHCQRGRQSMVVEHVHVHNGGQAIVGSMTQGKGGQGE